MSSHHEAIGLKMGANLFSVLQILDKLTVAQRKRKRKVKVK